MEGESAFGYDIIEEPICSTKLTERREDSGNKRAKKYKGEHSSTLEESGASMLNVDLSSFAIKGANQLLFENGLFDVVQKRDHTPYLKQNGGIVAQCRACLARIKGSFGVSSNFVTHLRRIHPEAYIKYEKQKKDKQEVYELGSSFTMGSDVAYVINKIENTKTMGWETYEIAEEPTYSSDFLKIEEVSMDTGFKQSSGVSLEKIGSPEESFDSTSMDLSSSEMKGANRLLFDNSFFEVLKKRDETPHLKKMGGILAQCLQCSTKIKGSLGVSSNFISHLRLQHPAEYAKYEALKKEKQKPENVKRKEQKKEQHNVCKGNASFDDKVLSFLASIYAPLSMVDNHAFINLFNNTDLKLNNSQVMSDILKDKYCNSVSDIRKALADVLYCCTCAHIWSAGQVNFFGYTCHWIDKNTFERKTVALACRQFSRSNENILEIINNIHREFGLNNNKILLTITDNDSDYYETLREYSATEKVMSMKIKTEVDAIIVDVAEDIDWHSLNKLPKHFQSASRTLNFLARIDFLNIIKKCEKLFSLHQQSFERCFNLWNKCSLPSSTQIIENILSCTLKTPTVIQWNSLFDSIKHLLLYKDKLPALCTNLNVSEFMPSEIEYLENYITLMTPIASALDFLQSDDKMYFGNFIATIVSLKVKLNRIEALGELTVLACVCNELIKCLLERFKTFFQIETAAEDAIVAAIACPNIKLRFVPVILQTAPEITMENIKKIFIRHATQLCCLKVKDEVFVGNSGHGFLDFGDDDEFLDVYRELELYLADSDTSFLCFQRYPIIRQVFLMYNTPIPSSAAPMGRLLPSIDMANISQRKKSSYANFEELVLMRANNL